MKQSIIEITPKKLLALFSVFIGLFAGCSTIDLQSKSIKIDFKAQEKKIVMGGKDSIPIYGEDSEEAIKVIEESLSDLPEIIISKIPLVPGVEYSKSINVIMEKLKQAEKHFEKLSKKHEMLEELATKEDLKKSHLYSKEQLSYEEIQKTKEFTHTVMIDFLIFLRLEAQLHFPVFTDCKPEHLYGQQDRFLDYKPYDLFSWRKDRKVETRKYSNQPGHSTYLLLRDQLDKLINNMPLMIKFALHHPKKEIQDFHFGILQILYHQLRFVKINFGLYSPTITNTTLNTVPLIPDENEFNDRRKRLYLYFHKNKLHENGTQYCSNVPSEFEMLTDWGTEKMFGLIPYTAVDPGVPDYDSTKVMFEKEYIEIGYSSSIFFKWFRDTLGLDDLFEPEKIHPDSIDKTAKIWMDYIEEHYMRKTKSGSFGYLDFFYHPLFALMKKLYRATIPEEKLYPVSGASV